ncbi:glycine cleavage system aminomethyltransferase T [Corchorus capsularis]|uniref:Glycine cleavage system aminomethyltransferase T n=1 Tax=Corchorus capsularis TaxID=210143 RepID=A0A1R3HCH3_COCAP|nr:glycine cleavage system aminomethyltransferase T [Corchorus capsularis]
MRRWPTAVEGAYQAKWQRSNGDGNGRMRRRDGVEWWRSGMLMEKEMKKDTSQSGLLLWFCSAKNKHSKCERKGG